MAKGNGTATADATNDTATNGTASTTADGATRPARSYIVVPVPADLKARFEAEAKTADVPVGPYVRNLLAKFLGIEIPATVTARRSKYGTEAERKAAQKSRNQSRSGTMRELMKAFRAAAASGKSPEEAAQLASASIAQLLRDGPPAAPAAPAEASAPAPEGEAVPA